MEAASFEVEYDPNKDLFDEGDPPDKIIVVCDGAVLLYHPRPNGNRMVFRIVRTGEVLGLAAVLLNQSYAFSAMTLARSRLRVIKSHAFLAELDAQPQLWKPVALEGVKRHYEVLAEVKKAPFVRLIELLLSFCAPSREPEAVSAPYRVRMKNQELADSVGVTERRIRQYLTKLRDQGLTTRERGWLVVLDPQGLRKLLEKIKSGKK